MICPRCGRALTSLEKFCPGCKSPLGARKKIGIEVKPKNLPTTQKYGAFSSSSDTQTKASKTTMYVLLGLVLLVVLLGVVAWALSAAQ